MSSSSFSPLAMSRSTTGSVVLPTVVLTAAAHYVLSRARACVCVGGVIIMHQKYMHKCHITILSSLSVGFCYPLLF